MDRGTAPHEQPQISVVVATYNRSSGLAPLVEALERQVGAPPFELIVVDDCSTDDTAVEIDRLTTRSTVALRYLQTDQNSGPAVARNIGWRAARGRWIAFTDDDCQPQPAWLAAMHRALQRADVVQGCTMPNPNHPQGVFSHTILRNDEHGFYETCNMGYRRDVLERVGGFDEQFRVPFGEDTDLAWRVIRTGARTTFEPDALVWHDVRPGDLRSKLRVLPREAGVVLAIRKHPGLRAYTQTPLFFKRSHPRALAMLGGLLLLALRPGIATVAAAAVLGRPWVTYQGRIVGRGEWLRSLPRLFLLDLAQVATLARASVRYRTLFL